MDAYVLSNGNRDDFKEFAGHREGRNGVFSYSKSERLGVNLNYLPITVSEAQSHAWGFCFERWPSDDRKARIFLPTPLARHECQTEEG